MDNLTLEEVEAVLTPGHPLSTVPSRRMLARQLAAVMRENAELKERLAVARKHCWESLDNADAHTARQHLLNALTAADLTQPWRKDNG